MSIDKRVMEAIDNLVDRATRARLNVLVPVIAVRNFLWARSETMPRLAEGAESAAASPAAASQPSRPPRSRRPRCFGRLCGISVP